MGQYYQKILTKHFSPLLNSCGIDTLTKSIYSGKGQILILHRVVPKLLKERIHNHLSLEISPEHLESIFVYFKEKNYDFIDLDTLPMWLETNRKTKKKFVIFTFDDGYKDNLRFAYPVFKKHNIPFIIYITSSIPDRQAIIWWYILEDLILKFDRVQYSFSVGSVNANCLTHRAKERAFIHIRKLINMLNCMNLEKELTDFFTQYGYNVLDHREEMGLTWDEISELIKDPIVSIGAHTLNHYNLRNLTKEQSFYEIMESKKILEKNLNIKVNHFSYPFGEFRSREIDFVKKCNFLTATTTENANIFYNHLNYLYALPRITINALTTKEVLNLQVNGFYPAILHKFRRVVH
jgi:peptidoglycan/xylan/chitin deacetylase (PgdA/CDA1 family)